jgi:hypothetical protein
MPFTLTARRVTSADVAGMPTFTLANSDEFQKKALLIALSPARFKRSFCCRQLIPNLVLRLSTEQASAAQARDKLLERQEKLQVRLGLEYKYLHSFGLAQGLLLVGWFVPGSSLGL